MDVIIDICDTNTEGFDDTDMYIHNYKMKYFDDYEYGYGSEEKDDHNTEEKDFIEEKDTTCTDDRKDADDRKDRKDTKSGDNSRRNSKLKISDDKYPLTVDYKKSIYDKKVSKQRITTDEESAIVDIYSLLKRRLRFLQSAFDCHEYLYSSLTKKADAIFYITLILTVSILVLNTLFTTASYPDVYFIVKVGVSALITIIAAIKSKEKYSVEAISHKKSAKLAYDLIISIEGFIARYDHSIEKINKYSQYIDAKISHYHDTCETIPHYVKIKFIRSSVTTPSSNNQMQEFDDKLTNKVINAHKRYVMSAPSTDTDTIQLNPVYNIRTMFDSPTRDIDTCNDNISNDNTCDDYNTSGDNIPDQNTMV